MDNRTGKIIYLDETEIAEAEAKWKAYKAGLLQEKPRYAPIKDDRIVSRKLSKRKRRKLRRKGVKFPND